MVNGISFTIIDIGREKNKLQVSGMEERKPPKALIVFFVCMLFCTLITQKVDYIMTTEVLLIDSVYKEITTTNEKVSFQYVLPEKCVYKEGTSYYTYVISPKKQSKDNDFVIKSTIDVIGNDGDNVIVKSRIENVVLYSSNRLFDGKEVRVIR